MTVGAATEVVHSGSDGRCRKLPAGTSSTRPAASPSAIGAGSTTSASAGLTPIAGSSCVADPDAQIPGLDSWALRKLRLDSTKDHQPQPGPSRIVYDVPRHLSPMSGDITRRREWDSNPRRLAPHGFSRAAHLSALPSLRATARVLGGRRPDVGPSQWSPPARISAVNPSIHVSASRFDDSTSLRMAGPAAPAAG